MRQKIKLLGLLLLIFIAGCITSNITGKRSEAQENEGRYRLFTSTYSYYINGFTGKDMDKKTLFKIDTVTGQVWRYMEYSDKPRVDEQWVAIPN